MNEMRLKLKTMFSSEPKPLVCYFAVQGEVADGTIGQQKGQFVFGQKY
ncbi:MAG: hypothetical protein LBS36_04990 [Oscillospiraceae bacterium]|nr:hypothetical protein [Oscillospiraceae bacterium]